MPENIYKTINNMIKGFTSEYFYFTKKLLPINGYKLLNITRTKQTDYFFAQLCKCLLFCPSMKQHN